MFLHPQWRQQGILHLETQAAQWKTISFISLSWTYELWQQKSLKSQFLSNNIIFLHELYKKLANQNEVLYMVYMEDQELKYSKL